MEPVASNMTLTVGCDDSHSVTSQPSQNEGKTSAKRKQPVVKYRKAPEAPKHPKTAFFLFSMYMHGERKKGTSQGQSISKKVPDAAKQISAAWKALSPEERRKWDEKAQKEKLRYQVEKTIYFDPLYVVKGEKRAKKDAAAPKRPMSAFLDFSLTLRSQVIKDNPHVSDNKEISKILGSMWRNATDEEKKPFLDKELVLRRQYNEDIRVFKTEKKDQQIAKRNNREAKVMDAIENGTCDQLMQAAEESRRRCEAPQVEAPQVIDVTDDEPRSNDSVDNYYAAAQYQSRLRPEESFGSHYQLQNTVPVFHCGTSHVPQYQNISSMPFTIEHFQGGQRLPHDHRQNYESANYSEQRRHHLMEQNASVHPPHLRGVQNHFLLVPSYNIIRMGGGDVSSIWQCPSNAIAPHSSQPFIFSALPNERNIPGVTEQVYGNHRIF